MKKRFLTKKMVVSTIILLTVVLTGMVVGFLGINAEPDMKEVVGEQFFGEFEPNVLVENNNCEYAPVAWIETRIIGIQADLWQKGRAEKETGDPDKQEILHNIYNYDDIETKMLVGTITSPIIQPINSEANYYVVYYEGIKQINAPQAYVYVGPNAEDGVLLDAKDYFYDENSGYLYIEESILTPWIQKGSLSSIRAETLFVCEDVKTVTKNVELVTIFSDNSGAQEEHKNGVANRVEEFNIRECQFDDITYRLVDSNKLAFFSKENMKVYFNGSPFDSWSYDECTGYLTISANIFSMKNIMVEITAINDVDEEQLSLQSIQVNDSLSPNAAGLTDVVRDYNEYIDYIQYDDVEPQLGYYQQMDYVSRVLLGVDRSGNAITPSVVSVTGSTHTSFPRTVLDLLTEKAKDNGYVNGYLKSATWATQSQIYDNVTGITRPSSVPPIADPNMQGDKLQSSEVYGEISYYLFKARHEVLTGGSNATTYINYVNDLADAYLFKFSGSRVFTNSDYANDSAQPYEKQWPTDRLVDNRWHTHCGAEQSRYVCGIKRTTEKFLGGVVHGSVLIDGDCCNIRGSASWATEINNVFGHNGNQTDYQCGTSIIYVSPVDETGYGDMWTCMWSRSLEPNTNSGGDAQRIQAYSKIKYKYNGNGRLRFTKVNEYGEMLSGAVYKIYQSDGTYVDSITTNNVAPIEVELKKGFYYVIEETPPTGYLKDDTKYTFEVKIDETCDVVAEDEFQLCEVKFTVFDKTTQGNTVEVPVPNIEFRLIDGSGTPIAFRNADGSACNYDTIKSVNGQVSFWVRTLDATPGIQVAGQPPQLYLSQVNTVSNYAKTIEPSSEDYCDKILISAFDPKDGVCPDNSGVNKSTTKKHYEHRQWVTMNAHVQDATLGTNTNKSYFGGDGFEDLSTEVRLDGAKFNIMTTSNNVLLGYTNIGDPVYLKPNVLIGYAQNGFNEDRNNPTILESEAKGGGTQKAYIGITSSLDNTDSMYTTGLSINKFNVLVGTQKQSFDSYGWDSKDKEPDGIYTKIMDGIFELPNAVYDIVLTNPSPGYRRTANVQDQKNSTIDIWDGEGIHADNITTFDASWRNDPNSYNNYILFLGNNDSQYNVKLHRQTVSIDTFVKGYFKEDKTISSSSNGNLIRNDFHTLNPFDINNLINYKNGASKIRDILTINKNTKKQTKTSNSNNRISIDSKEYVSVADKDNNGAFSNVLSVETRSTADLLARNVRLGEVIVEIYNLTEIVDVETGKVIKAHNVDDIHGGDTANPLGRYQVDENGYVLIDKLGSARIQNPQPLLTSSKSYIDAVYPKAEDASVYDHALPNGVYYIRIYQLGLNMQSEYGLAENIIYTTAWSEDKVTIHNVEDDSLHLVQVKPDDEVYDLNIAPDLPLSKDDDLRYDPQDVVSTKNKILIGNEKRLTEILGCRQIDTNYQAALNWIDKHMYDYSYRIFEMINNDPTDDTADDPNFNTEIADNLPTTFAFYINHDIKYEANVDYHYYTTYYYQITKDEYDVATSDEIGNKTYMRVNGLYYKKFNSRELLNCLAINHDSAGYVRYIEGGYEIDSNKPIMGAVYNLAWVNERMMNASVEGTYRILVQLDVEKTTTNFLSGVQTVDHLNSTLGELRIKNRNLFDLD